MSKCIVSGVTLLCVILILGYFIKAKSGVIVLLNGTSSSGKSALLKEFQKNNTEWRIMRVDEWFPQELQKKATELGWKKESTISPWVYLHQYMSHKSGISYFDTELREELFSDVSSFYQKAEQKALKGHNVILDTVLEYEGAYTEFYKFFKGSKVITVLVYCPLDVLLKRVQERNALGIPEEQRTAFQSFEQFLGMYKVQESEAEKVVDVIKTSLLKKSLDEAIEELVKNSIPSTYYPKLEAFKKKFIQEFKLDSHEYISLVPKHYYDLILYSARYSSVELAETLASFLAHKVG